MAFVYVIFDWQKVKQRTQWLLHGILIHTTLASLSDSLHRRGFSLSLCPRLASWTEERVLCQLRNALSCQEFLAKVARPGRGLLPWTWRMSASLYHHCTLPFSWKVSMWVQSAGLSQLHSSRPVLLPVSLEHHIVSFTEESEATLVGASFSPLCYLKYLDYCAAVLPSFRSNVPSAAQVLFLFHISSFLCHLSFCFPI